MNIGVHPVSPVFIRVAGVFQGRRSRRALRELSTPALGSQSVHLLIGERLLSGG